MHGKHKAWRLAWIDVTFYALTSPVWGRTLGTSADVCWTWGHAVASALPFPMQRSVPSIPVAPSGGSLVPEVTHSSFRVQ